MWCDDEFMNCIDFINHSKSLLQLPNNNSSNFNEAFGWFLQIYETNASPEGLVAFRGKGGKKEKKKKNLQAKSLPMKLKIPTQTQIYTPKPKYNS